MSDVIKSENIIPLSSLKYEDGKQFLKPKKNKLFIEHFSSWVALFLSFSFGIVLLTYEFGPSAFIIFIVPLFFVWYFFAYPFVNDIKSYKEERLKFKRLNLIYYRCLFDKEKSIIFDPKTKEESIMEDVEVIALIRKIEKLDKIEEDKKDEIEKGKEVIKQREFYRKQKIERIRKQW